MKKNIKLFGIFLILLIIPFLIIPLSETYLLFTISILMIFLYSLFSLWYPLFFIPAIIFYNEAMLNLLPILFFVIGLTIIIRIIFYKRKCIMIIHPIFLTFLANGFYMLINKSFNLEILFLDILMSILVVIVFFVSIKQFKTDEKIIYKIKKIKLLIAVIMIFLVLGSMLYENNYFNIDLTFILICLSILILSYIDSFDFSFLFSIFGLFIYYYIYKLDQISFVFPLLSLVFIKNKKYSNLILMFLLVMDLYFFSFFSYKDYEVYLIFILAFFEIIKIFIGYFPNFKKNNQISLIYNNILDNFNEQIIKFAGFLDEFSRNFITNNEENIRLSEAFNNLIQTFCVKCPKKNDCFGTKKQETYYFLKNCLCYGNKIHVKKNTLELKEMIKICYFSNEMIEKANILKNKYQLFLKNNIYEKNLEKQLEGLSNTLRQYVVDLNSKNNIQIDVFKKFQIILKEMGYEIVLYNIRKMYVDDFWVEIGIYNITYKEVLEVIMPVATDFFNDITIEKIENDSKDVIYFSILPKIKFNISYGYASLAKENLNIIGDNYLIKKIGDGNFVAAISDGMGSGYKAFQESKSTIKLIDKVTEFEVNCHTSMNILNTFYSLKDSFDQYATLDFLQINRKNGEAFLYKMGGTNTYIIRNNEYLTFKNSNLPFGITDLISYETFNVIKDDLIVLMSDGIMDNINESKLIDILKYSSHKKPQKVCYDIINHIEKTNTKLHDDMSIILLKVE